MRAIVAELFGMMAGRSVGAGSLQRRGNAGQLEARQLADSFNRYQGTDELPWSELGVEVVFDCTG